MWRNPEAKREVIAQAIDYASELSKWSFEQLDMETRRHSKKGIVELIQSTFDLDQEELPSEDEIANQLHLGRFLVLVVSEHIRSSLVDMLNYMNRFPHLATNVGLIELQCYRMPDDQSDILVVPSIVAKTEVVERSIVQVNLTPNVPHTIAVEQQKSEPSAEGGRALSEDAFWELLRQKPSNVQPASQILDHFRKYSEIVLKMRKTAVVARMNLPDSDQRLSLFNIATDGSLHCWSSTVILQLENAGISRELGEEYERDLQKILTRKYGKVSVYSPIDQVDVVAFSAVVDAFIAKVLKAEIISEEI